MSSNGLSHLAATRVATEPTSDFNARWPREPVTSTSIYGLDFQVVARGDPPRDLG